MAHLNTPLLRLTWDRQPVWMRGVLWCGLFFYCLFVLRPALPMATPVHVWGNVAHAMMMDHAHDCDERAQQSLSAQSAFDGAACQIDCALALALPLPVSPLKLLSTPRYAWLPAAVLPMLSWLAPPDHPPPIG